MPSNCADCGRELTTEETREADVWTERGVDEIIDLMHRATDAAMGGEPRPATPDAQLCIDCSLRNYQSRFQPLPGPYVLSPNDAGIVVQQGLLSEAEGAGGELVHGGTVCAIPNNGEQSIGQLVATAFAIQSLPQMIEILERLDQGDDPSALRKEASALLATIRGNTDQGRKMIRLLYPILRGLK